MKTKIFIGILIVIGLIAIFQIKAQDFGCKNLNFQEIKNQAEKIERDKINYSMNSQDIFGRSSEGGLQKNYIDGGETVLIEQTFFGEIGKSEASYYFQDGKVFYVVKKNIFYEVPIYEGPDIKIKNVDIKEFYLNDREDICSWYMNGEAQSINKDTKELVNYLIAGLD